MAPLHKTTVTLQLMVSLQSMVTTVQVISNASGYLVRI